MVLAAAAALGPVPGARAADPPAAPLRGPFLDPPRPLVLSSSFGEYRPGHYHGGLDYSTGGREGLAVVAPADGEVWRVRASGVGYGRSLYFRFDDGRTSLYGHLSAYAPRIARVVDAAQDRAGRYEVDFEPDPGDSLRFRAGEVLGYSGSTGAGPPHLHAELRTGPEASIAVNPLTQGWSAPDSVAPSLTRLRAAPAAAGARVNGGTEPVEIPLTPGGAGPRLRIAGPVDLWVECVDRTDGEGNRIAPYEVAWSVDGRPGARIRFREFDWNAPQEVERTFDEALARSRNQRWISLDPPGRARQPVAAWRGEGDPLASVKAAGPHRLSVEARDLAGNAVACVAEILLEDPPAPGSPVDDPPVGETGMASAGPFLRWRVAADSARFEARGPEGASADAAWVVGPAPGGLVAELGAPEPDRDGLWTLGAALPGGAALAARAVRVRGSAPVRIEAGRVALDFPPGAVYRPLWVGIEEPEGTARADAGSPDLVPVGGEVRLTPWAAALRDEASVGLAPPPGTSRKGLALYRWEDGWRFVGADSTATGIAGSIGNLETLALLRDEVPPRITLLPPGAGARPALAAHVADGGAGVTWRTLTMTLDGRPVIADWDPEAARFTAHLRSALAPGGHRWRVTAADRAGNHAEREQAFTVP